MTKHTLTQDSLDQFYGSETLYRHWTGRLDYTEGVKYMADFGGAYWLIDAIASYQPHSESFQLWELVRVDRGASTGARLTMRGDSNWPAAVTQDIEYTDFPLDSIKLYVENGVLMLPGER